MAAADILLVIQPDTDLQVPGKLFEMLMFEKPILALTGEGETADMIVRCGIGETAPAYDATAIAQAIGRLRDRRSLTEAWQPALGEFDGRRLTGELADLLSAVSNIGIRRGKATVTC
jgi:glycosyltransferase involved in cell wall biosynthesis